MTIVISGGLMKPNVTIFALFLCLCLPVILLSGCGKNDGLNTPSGLSADILSDSQIRLSWIDTSGNENEFVIERSEEDRAFEVIAIVAADTTLLTDERVLPETSYTYRVKARNGEEESGYSNTVTVLIPSDIPDPPSGLIATAHSHDTIRLTWNDNSDNESSFVIERRTEGGEYDDLVTLGENQVSYSDIECSADTGYTYRIKAVNVVGDSNWSATASATTPEDIFSGTVPEAPDNLTAIAVSDNRIYLTWSDNSDNESSFVIERRTADSGFAVIVTLQADTEFYSNNMLTASTEYTYRIKATNSEGDSNWSGTATATTQDVVDSEAVVVDHLCTDLSLIPEQAIINAKQTLHIAYGHTSHGSQLISGMNELENYMATIDDRSPGLYAWNDGPAEGNLDLDDGAMDGDVGYYPAWEDNTRSYLGVPDAETGRGTSQPEVNVIIWSWCGQVPSKYNDGKINSDYLSPMATLENAYPGITFVYMTGHMDNGNDASLKAGNAMIRDYCITNNKVLFDFAALDTHDPDGNYFEYSDDACYYFDGPSGTQLGNWASEYLADSPIPELFELVNGNDAGYPGCNYCAHSPEGGETNDAKLNCILKGRAAWWLWARIAGWDGNP